MVPDGSRSNFGKYMVGCLTNLIVFVCDRKQELHIIILLKFVVLWVVCGCLIEWWMSRGHMYVMHTVNKHSDRQYSCQVLSEKVAI